jgi:hypothetical protein
MIDLTTRGTQGQSNPRRQVMAQKMAAQNILPAPANIQILPAEQARPLLGDVLPGIVRDAIDADITSIEQGEPHD